MTSYPDPPGTAGSVTPGEATGAPEATATPGEPGTPGETGIGLLRIDHVGVAVPDLDTAIGFYQRVFGMTCVHVEENEEQGVREAMLAVGPDPTGGCVQLLAPLRPDSTIAKFLDRSGPGVQQVAYTVVDVEAAAAALRARGVRVLYDAARRGTAGSRVNFVHPKDTGGVLVELVEPAGTQHSAH
jgi:methylmalonyl-CoA/ethylmalonyl-CoA epimerase